MQFKPLRRSLGAISIETATQSVIGRDELSSKLWRAIDGQSVRLLSERRMGKTWLLKLAIALKPDWAKVVFFDAEGVHDTTEFVLELNKELHNSNIIQDDWWGTVSDWARRQVQKIEGTRVAGVELPALETWKNLLRDTCKHFAANAGPSGKAVLFIDELPFFLDNLIKAGQTNQAIEFLDTLRHIRQSQPSFRLLTCGSLGLHIVFEKLHQAGYTGQPMNDMPPFEVIPLDENDAIYLAGCLLTGENINCDNTDSVAIAIAKVGSCVPFYIQHIINWMIVNSSGKPWGPRDIEDVLFHLFEEPGDPAEFNYYEGRLDQYYAPEIAERSRLILDVLSRSASGEETSRLLQLVRHSPQSQMMEMRQLLHTLDLLLNDHYIAKSNNDWRFKLEIVRRSWNLKRGGFAS